ncbi:MAG: SpvB/TcaC N-terminal domain-containing protein [Bacteroidota bacterium]
MDAETRGRERPSQEGVAAISEERSTESNAIEIPEITLPKGGGALSGIDEKFEVNAVNGTAGLSVPLPLTPGRNGFSPSLSLSYNSGGGNGPFGLGWAMALPMIQRKTDKRLPRYRNGKEEDIFMFSGAEDLVPFLEEVGGSWQEKEYTNNGAGGYTVKRYRPRIEGGFERIEKIHHPDHGVYWKVTTGTNTVTIFGRSPSARIADPEDETLVFQWMPEFGYDNKGNWIQYQYKKEDLTNVPNAAYEKNRIKGIATFTNTYLKAVKYGNRRPYYADNAKPYDPQPPADTEHFFEAVLDYGEHNVLNPAPQDTGLWDYRPDAFSSYRPGFEIRTNRLCKRVLMFHHFTDEKQFVGTPEEEVFGVNYLVSSLDFEYAPSSINGSGRSETTYLMAISQNGYVRKPDGTYSKKELPPLELTYQALEWDNTIKNVDAETIIHAPVGLTNNYQWVDLYGEGISGILTEQGGGWFYKSNWGDVEEEGNVAFSTAQNVLPKPSFTGLSSGVLSIQDLAANGEKQVVVNDGSLKGYFELDQEHDWKPFRPFAQAVNVDLQDSNTRLLDLNGDGQPEIVVTEENAFTWYSADGKNGYLPAERTYKPYEEELGPSIVFANQSETIFLADMTGDGLTDIVRIRNGAVCYWANKGYGKFSAKIRMENAPIFDYPDQYNPEYLHLADISGTGATDIMYLGETTFKAYINLSGNSWSDVHEIEPFFPFDTNSKLSVIDLLGTGTSCLVWSSDLPAHTGAPMRYIDLMGSKKPHVLIHHKNNFGKETTVTYKSSTHFYLKDKLEGKPWISKLPFPVQVVSKLQVEEKITNVRFTTEYSYHHGYFDHAEREFRGFGRVEQKDSEHYETWVRNNATSALESSEALYQSPVLTKTWFHTGAFLDRERILDQYKNEYWHVVYNKQFLANPISVTEPELPDAQLTSAVKTLVGDEYREALRACKGMMLRQEVFALDAPENPTDIELQLQSKPYSVAAHNCHVQLLQPRHENTFGVFMVTESEAISIAYERDETDYRLTHTLNTKIDELGNVLENAAVVYGRQQEKANAHFQLLTDTVTDFAEDVLNGDAAQMVQLQDAFTTNIQAAKDEQTKAHITYTQNSFAKYNDGSTDHDDIDLPTVYRTRLPYENKSYELTGFVPTGDLFQRTELESALAMATEIAYHESAGIGSQKRLIAHTRTKYRDDNFNELGFGIYDTEGLSYENYQLAFTTALVHEIYHDSGAPLQVDGDPVVDFIALKGKFTTIDGDLWIRSGITHLKVNAAEAITNVKDRFYAPLAFEDPFGSVTEVTYDTETFTGAVRNNDGYYLYIKYTIDALDSKAGVMVYNYRTMSSVRMFDMNANPSSILTDELGLVKALAVEGNGEFTDATRTAVNILEAADSLIGLKEYSEATETAHVAQLLGAATLGNTDTNALRQAGNALLQQASSRFIHDFDTYRNTGNQPIMSASIIREEHFADNPNSAIHFSFEYSEGMGNVAMTKVQAEPGLAFFMDNNDQRQEKDTGNDLRWVGNGRTVLNNKGNAVKQYESYFSTNFLYENAPELVEIGVTSITYYDSLGRMVKNENADGTLSRVEFDAWQQRNYDQNDTVLESKWYNDRINNLIDAQLTAEGKDPAKERQAAQKAALHANTPSSLHFDSLGRPVLSIAHGGKDTMSKDRYHTTFINLDVEGNTHSITDARGNTVMAYRYDMLGHRLYQSGMDSGQRWVLNNLMGQPLHRWDSRGHIYSFDYDLAQRPFSIKVQGGDGPSALDHSYEHTVYGEGQANEYQHNLRGQVVEQYDTAGKSENLRFDFKGNILESNRQFNADYKNVPNWIAGNLNNPALFDSDLTTYTTQLAYDAMNRVSLTTTPDSSEMRSVFNEAGLLEEVRVTQTGVAEKVFVKDIDHDAKGQRERIVYGDRNGNNLATTTYQYDQKNFRLIQLHTVNSNGDTIQDLRYTYDPMGNISEITNRALPTKFFSNFRIEPRGIYTYDARYRLVRAEGREHAGQAINFGQCDYWRDQNHLRTYNPGDDMAWRNYTQNYAYDPVGNILRMGHTANGGNWTREYAYETGTNRLAQTHVGGQTYAYTHHTAQGNMTSLPHLHRMEWNFKGELQATAKQAVCNSNLPPEITYYVYDGSGERVRKVTETHGGGNKKEERVYLGGIEVYKKHSGPHSGLQRTTLHVMDDNQRIAMIDTRNGINNNTDQRTVRFQFGNHLGSACLELDDLGNTISYEEYHPYGTTSYQATNNTLTASAKRYRYTGKERDEETGLEYHSARYYLPWLARWQKPDPIGIEGGINLYAYVKGNPVILHDPSGNDARVSVDQQNRTITYSTTQHIYGSAEDISNFRAMGDRVTDFFRNSSGTVNIDGEQWTVNYNVAFQYHDVAQDPRPTEYGQIGQIWGQFLNSPNASTSRPPAELRGLLDTAIGKTTGFQDGDNVLFMQGFGGSQTRTAGGFTLDTSDGTTPHRRALAIVNTNFGLGDPLYRALIHEIGHQLGFDERYAGANSAHQGYDTDFMSSKPNATGFHPSHLESSARFALHAANGNNLNNVAMKGFQVDDTRLGRLEQFQSNGSVNPNYTSQQALLKQGHWSHFQQAQIPSPNRAPVPTPTPQPSQPILPPFSLPPLGPLTPPRTSPPRLMLPELNFPPTLQIFPLPTSPRYPIQILPQYDYNAPLYRPPLLQPSTTNTIPIFRFNF